MQKLPMVYVRVCRAWGYYTAAIRGEVPREYDLITIMEWARARPWSMGYPDYRDFRQECQIILNYLDKWSSPEWVEPDQCDDP